MGPRNLRRKGDLRMTQEGALELCAFLTAEFGTPDATLYLEYEGRLL
jgi:hypothetical protein